MDMESDATTWFHAEVSNIVLAAWAEYPKVTQASHEKPLTDESVAETVDVAYSIKKKGVRRHILIGEFKRGIIDPGPWTSGSVPKSSSESLARELRGYV
jgi:hypothetical protein